LLLIFLTGAANLSAQTFSLGAKGGASISYYSNFDKMGGLLKRIPNIGIDAGLIGNVKLTKLLSLQFELLYEQKGEQYKLTIETTETAKINLNYITMPILLQFSHTFGKIKLFYGAGPYMGYALDGRMTDSESKENVKFGKDNFRRFDAGATVNLGFGIKAGRGHIFLDARYNYGFMDVEQLSHKPDGYKPHNNRNFAVCAGYMIPLGK
jgi:hypothetical protein